MCMQRLRHDETPGCVRVKEHGSDDLKWAEMDQDQIVQAQHPFLLRQLPTMPYSKWSYAWGL